ncbi:MAG: hypothetical protein AAF289_01650 [Cyanobacteria bacterium P01_A01_bin.135]
MQTHWSAITSKDFGNLLYRYNLDAVLVWNNHGEKNVYLGAEISDYWQLFFSQHAIGAYRVSNVERDRDVIKAEIIAKVRSSKGNVKKLHITHQLQVDSRGKISQEVWTLNGATTKERK